MQTKITLLGWINYNPELFNKVTFPDGIDKNIAVQTILMRCGEFPIIYSNAEFLQFAIVNWAERHAAQFERMYKALSEEYNPLYNYDRNEEYTDTRSSTGTTKNSGTVRSTNSGTENNVIENTVSADNVSIYQPDNKSVEDKDSSGSSKTDDEASGSSSSLDNIQHKAHLYGNIGVTTSATMATEEVTLRSTFGVYDLIAANFAQEFCIMIY